MNKAVVIGSGPAGVSAAIYLKRAGADVAVFSMGAGALLKAEKIENYYGLERPLSGTELFARGEAQLESLGIPIVREEVVGLSYEDGYVVTTKSGRYTAAALVLCLGANRLAPKLKGLREFEGAGVSYCAACDGFFYRGKDVAVLGSGEYAFHEAAELLPLARSVTLLTDGKKAQNVPDGLAVREEKLLELRGGETLKEAVFEDGSALELSGLFVALGTATGADLAKKLGAPMNGNKLAVDENMSLGLPGLYAAGDCAGGMLQVAKAVYEGALAGTNAAKFMRANERS